MPKILKINPTKDGGGQLWAWGLFVAQERCGNKTDCEKRIQRNLTVKSEPAVNSLDFMSGQVSAFGLMLGQINQNGSLGINEISNAMKKLVLDNKSPKDKNLAIRNKLSDLWQQYQTLNTVECAPRNIGPTTSGAAHTQATCDDKFGNWDGEARNYVCSNLENTDCIECRWGRDLSERAEILKRLIERYRN